MTRQPPTRPLDTAVLIMGGIVVTVMVTGVTVDVGIGRDPSILVNFCGILIAQGVTAFGLYLGLNTKITRTAATVEELANGGGKAQTKAAVHEALNEHSATTLDGADGVDPPTR